MMNGLKYFDEKVSLENHYDINCKIKDMELNEVVKNKISEKWQLNSDIKWIIDYYSLMSKCRHLSWIKRIKEFIED